jgi:uncharacterized repeat protein (TIGR03803 family)
MSVTRRAVAAFAVVVISFSKPIDLPAQDPGDTFCVLHHFGDPASAAKDASLNLQQAGVIAVADDGSLWTTASQGGNFNAGAVIRITPDGQYTRVADFNPAITGAGPQGGLVNGNNGYMYGTTTGGGKWGPGTIFRVSQKGGAAEVIYDFRNGRNSGLVPKDCKTPLNCAYSPAQRRDMSGGFPVSAPVVIGGNLYGVTTYSNAQGYGTLYTIPVNTAPRSNTFTATTLEDGDEKMHVLCIFQPNLVNDATGMKDFRCNTNGVTATFLTVGRDGNLYGTTTGVHGSVFKATTGGQVTSLHEFNGQDGDRPFALMQASDGNLYGTTAAGGVGNWGTLYRINPTVVDFLALKYFGQKTDNLYGGYYPVAGVAEGEDGQLYGAVRAGGLISGGGWLYHIAKDGSNFGILHEFNNGENGAWPVTTPVVIEDKTYATTIYGTTDLGGTPLIGLLGTFYRMRVNRVSITRGVQKSAYGVVDVRADATATQGAAADLKERDHGIAVRLKCDTDPHWVQFIYREVIQPDSALVPPGDESHPYGKLLPKSALATGCCQSKPLNPDNTNSYSLTTDRSDIHWNPDAPDMFNDSSKGSPYFEAGHSAERDCGSLTLFDRPEVAAADLVSSRVARAVVRDYAICGGVLKMQVTWIADQTLDQNQQSQWKYQAMVGPVLDDKKQPTTKMPDYFLCLLKNKLYPLPGGQSITPGYDCAHLPAAKVGQP